MDEERTTRGSNLRQSVRESQQSARLPSPFPKWLLVAFYPRSIGGVYKALASASGMLLPELDVRSMAMDQSSEGQWFLRDNCFRLKGKPTHSQESIRRSLFSEGRGERWGEVGKKVGKRGDRE